MHKYHNATICMSGHVIDSYNAILNEHCTECGDAAITTCPHCNANIRGELNQDMVITLAPFVPPKYCHNCGKAYPWTISSLESAKKIILEDNKSQQSEKENMIQSLKDIIVETPKTNLAIMRTKKFLTAAGKFTADSMRQFIIEFGCELVKKQFIP